MNVEQYLYSNPLLAFPVVFAAGVLISFTPCVFPLIPVTLSFIGAREAKTKSKALLISIIYVVGIATTYATLGAVSALTGKIFGILTQKPGIYLVVGNVFIFLGLNMLGVFQLNFLTSGWAQKFIPQKSSGYISTFIIGLISGLIVGPCTAPALGALLVFVATKQNVIFGILLLFIFALGMGTLLVIVGTFANIIKLRSGPWMEKIEKIFGWFLILTGEYFILRAGQLWI